MRDMDSFIDQTAELIDLPIDDKDREALRNYLEAAQDMAKMLESVPLDQDELAFAPVYQPPERSS